MRSARWILPLSALLLLSGAPGSAAPVAPAAPDAARGGDGSLEELLREVRRRREASAAKLAEPVRALLERLDKAAPADKAEYEAIKAALLALGVEAAPLLVGRLDPGPNALTPDKRRAALVADVLEQLPTRSVTEAVMQVARKGTPAGRVNALRVLGNSPDRAAAGACLVEAFRTQEGEVRLEAVRSLARLGGPEHEGVLVEALGEVDHDVLSAVLTALAESGTPAGREQVRTLAGAPAQANTLVKEILAYERAIAASLGPEDFEALVRLAGSPGPVKDDRRLILDTVAELHPQLDAKLRKLFDPLLAEVDEDLHLSAQLCLARLGDRNERRDVLKRFDELVARNEEWAGAYEQRGAVLLKLGDYGEAAKDYAHAIKVYKDINRSDVAETLYVDLARAHVLDQNLKKAHEALIEGGVSRSVLKQLAQDPDFRPLVEHGRYGRIFD